MNIKTTVEFRVRPDGAETEFTVGQKVETDQVDVAVKRAVDWLTHNNVQCVKIEVTK